jgi:PAS domain S-box-containing protein
VDESLLRDILESVGEGILVVDNNGRVTHANKLFGQMWRIPHQLIETRDDQKLLAFVFDQLEDPVSFLDRVRQLYLSTEEDIDTIRFKDGRLFERTSKPLLKDGKITGRVWSFRDVTDRKQAEYALWKSEQKYSNLFKQSNDAIIVHDPTGQILEINQRAVSQFGYARDEMLTMSVKDLHPPHAEETSRQALETIQREGYVKIEIDFVRKNGHTFTAEVSSSMLEVNGRHLIQGIVRDISERKLAEYRAQDLQRRLARMEKMESLAILAGGVAHDLNNMLGPLVGYPELILRKLPEDSPIRNQIRKIGQAAGDAVDVIQDLLSLARRGRYDMQPISVNEVITGFLDSRAYTRLSEEHKGIKVTLELTEDLPLIHGSAAHLAKVIMNLVHNAFDAMPEGGTVTISTEHHKMSRLDSGYAAIEAGEYITIRVTDTGIGIAEENLKRIFEPYYSKKKMGISGSGLGLAVVYGIVKDHHGYYDIFSEVGVGTQFVLYFPVTTENAQTAEGSGEIAGGTESVLVIDDVLEQRDLAGDLLASLGYRVDAAANGPEAVRLIKENNYDLLVLDMIMEEDCDGFDTYRQIVEFRPRQRAVIVSGYAETERVHKTQELGAGEFVRKPYTLETLGRAVRRELDKTGYATGTAPIE